jgi:hypothetical protein
MTRILPKMTAILLAVILMATTDGLVVNKSHAGPILGGIGGAIGGGIMGRIIGGRRGARIGRVIGGVAGFARGARRASRRRRYYDRHYYRPYPRPYYRQNNYRAAAAPARQSAVSSTLILSIQQSLVRLGYDPGPVDGVAGSKVRQAIQSYQGDQKLLVTGEPSQQLAKHMLKNGG